MSDLALWILRPVAAWDPWYDKAFGFVVRAESADAARKLVASADQGGEGPGMEGPVVWGDPAPTTCEQLAENGTPGVVMRDFASA